jgi:formylglycine-generating enzyme required for sulfatase activity
VAELHYLEKYVAGLSSIPSGEFRMGEFNSRTDEQPVRTVTLSEYRLGAAPVTVALWREYCVFTEQRMPDPPEWGWLDEHPIVNVSWADIVGLDGESSFCAWASTIAGIEFTLPTEAQYEYVARGCAAFRFPWGNKIDHSKLWFSGVDDSEKIFMTAPVNRTQRIFESYGLVDLVGNVKHWCLDWYGPYSCGSNLDPRGPKDSPNARRVTRGCGWNESSSYRMNSYFRSCYYPLHGCNNIGFRLSAGPG